jgi:DNA modification methylase
VLDPFNGSGTTGVVSLQQGRHYVGIELNPAYIELTAKRLAVEAELAQGRLWE